MRMNRRESFAVGELVLFVAVWLLAMATTLSDYSGRSSDVAKSNDATSGVSTHGSPSFGNRSTLD